MRYDRYEPDEPSRKVEFGNHEYEVYRNCNGGFSTIPNNMRLEAILNDAGAGSVAEGVIEYR